MHKIYQGEDTNDSLVQMKKTSQIRSSIVGLRFFFFSPSLIKFQTTDTLEPQQASGHSLNSSNRPISRLHTIQR